ncbi:MULTISPECIES: DsbC family protein [Novosphingobium]|uniref:DsbC family protein n=1 Tax=Novosphingobium TaxID=165696 RepID=UPI000ACAFDEA|nr:MULTISPECIES: DsbC family protein [Novosphingobium]
MDKRFALTVMIALGVAGGSAMAAALAATPSAEDRVGQALKVRLPRTAPTHIDCAVVAGLCEVQAGANLFYTDTSGRYLVVGRVYDMETRQDLTAARLLAINPDLLAGTGARANQMADEAGAPEGASAPPVVQRASAPAPDSKVSLAALAPTGAIEWGRGRDRLTVFSDFHCGYCKLLHQQLQMMDVRVTERPISLLGTRMISEAVICAPDRRAALERAYAGEALPAARCDTSGLDANERFAREHGFDGTPVIVRGDGAVLHGYRSKEVLATWLAGGKVS